MSVVDVLPRPPLLRTVLLMLPLILLPGLGIAADGELLNLTSHWVGYFSIAVFVVAYLLVMAEEFTHLRKSKPVIIAAGLIWAVVAWVYQAHGYTTEAEHALRHNLLEYAELMLFLLVAMTYINAMEERQVFRCSGSPGHWPS